MKSVRAKAGSVATLVALLAGMQLTATWSEAVIIVRDHTGNILSGATSIALTELTNSLASIQIDDKRFENWPDFASVATGGAVPADPAQIKVAAVGEGSCVPGPGVQFVSAQFLVKDVAQSQHTVFSYDVRAINAKPVIEDIGLRLA